jgi:hypothetical protein
MTPPRGSGGLGSIRNVQVQRQHPPTLPPSRDIAEEKELITFFVLTGSIILVGPGRFELPTF